MMKNYDKFKTKEYQTLIDKIPIGIGISDYEGNIISCNKIMLETLGYSKEMLHKLGVSVLYANPRDRDIIRNVLFKEHKIQDKEILLKTQEGKEFNALMNIDMEEGEDGVFFYSTIQDISKQKEAEKKLRESEERYRTLYKNLPVPTYTWQKQQDDLVLIDYNDAGAAITNNKVKDVIGLKAKDVYSDRMYIVEDMMRALNNQTTFSIETEYFIKVIGETKFFNIKYAFTPPDLVLVHTEDITQRKNAELNLKESEKKYREAYHKLNQSEARYRLLAENINDIIWTMDLDLKTTYVSPSVKTVLGYTTEEDMAMSINKKFTQESLKKIYDIVRKQINPKNINNPDFNPVLTLEMEQHHKNGSIVPTEVKVNPMRNKKGVAEGLIGVTRDITERKKHENKLIKSEKKYRQAFTRAEFYKDLFAHDIANLLQGVYSSTQMIEILLKDFKELNKAKSSLDIIKEQINRGSKLVNNIRRLSQIEDNEIYLQEIEIISILNDIIQYFKDQDHNRPLIITLESKLNECFILGNDLINDVFENLILNAIIHNLNPTIEINIIISRVEIDDTSNIQIEFIDNGKGIEEDRKQIIFQREGKGDIGLGLSLVKKIIQIFKGRIWVENKVQNNHTQGSKFIILFPMN